MKMFSGMSKLALGLATLGAIGLSVVPAQASFDDQFVCDAIGDGNYVVTISSLDGSKASAVYQLGDEYAAEGAPIATELRAAVSASGFRYVGGGIEFHGKGNEALLTENGETVPCHFKGEQAGQGEQVGQDDLPDLSNDIAWPPLNAMGFSLGGKVRAAPSMDAPQVGSLQHKEPVVLIQNSGIEMDGYYWFKISHGEGEEGYQWGGVLCSDALHVIGIYESCE